MACIYLMSDPKSDALTIRAMAAFMVQSMGIEPINKHVRPSSDSQYVSIAIPYFLTIQASYSHPNTF
jgi:hypothetical protein